MTRKQFRVVTGEGAREGQYTGDVVLLNDDGSDWSPEGSGATDVRVDDVQGLQELIDDMQTEIDDLKTQVGELQNDGGGDDAA